MAKIKRTKKKAESVPYKVFAFMVNPHTLIMVSQDGKKVADIYVESEVQAKEKLTDETLNTQIIEAIGQTNYSTIWTDDPAGDPAVLDACRKMEQGEAEEILADAVGNEIISPETDVKEEATATEIPITATENADTVTETPGSVETNENGQVHIHTKGMVFQTEVDGEFKNIPGQLLNIDDTCRFFPEREPVNEKLWRVIASPINSGPEEEGDYIIHLQMIEGEKKGENVIEEAPPAAPQYLATGTKKIIEVECAITRSEERIRTLVREVQRLKGEALADAAEYRERIKTAEKALFAECDGKSYTQMECTIENDWDAGTRRYIRPDTGEVAKVEQIPYAERQLNMNSALDDATPGTDKTEEQAVESEKSSSETVVDENALTSDDVSNVSPSNEVEENGAAGDNGSEPDETTENDFPPPDEGEYKGE